MKIIASDKLTKEMLIYIFILFWEEKNHGIDSQAIVYLSWEESIKKHIIN
jgi:hypothetical protein